MSQYCKLLWYSCFIFVLGSWGMPDFLHAQHTNNLEGLLSYPLNKSFVIYDYANNVDELHSLHGYITKTLSNPALVVRKIKVTGYSSPEGSYEHNEKLAQERAENLTKYLHSFFADNDIEVECVPEDWNGLIDLLAEANYPDIDIVRPIAQADLDPAEKEKKLKRLPRRIYKDLNRNYFPRLRRATLTIYCEQAPETPHNEDINIGHKAIETETEPETHLRTQQYVQYDRNAELYRRTIQNNALTDRYGYSYRGKRRKPRAATSFSDNFTPTIAIGTNLLQWAGFRPDFTHTTTIPNVYAEYYFLKRWSVKGAFAYCDWSYDNGKRFQGISSYSIEPRFWLKKDGKFRGFFVGIYGQIGDYNQQEAEQNYTGKYHSEGLSAGYLLPLYKGLAVEVSLRGGYRHASVKKYKTNEECSSLCRKYSKNEITLTGSCLSLIYRF